MREEWRDVVGYEGLYEISNLARIRRGRQASQIRKAGSIITQRVDHYGYWVVDLWRDARQKRPRVHVLLMRAWVGVRTARDIRHLDGNKLNNSLSNLRYGTRSENLKDDYKHNPQRAGFRNPATTRKAVRNRIRSVRRRIQCTMP